VYSGKFWYFAADLADKQIDLRRQVFVWAGGKWTEEYAGPQNTSRRCHRIEERLQVRIVPLLLRSVETIPAEVLHDKNRASRAVQRSLYRCSSEGVVAQTQRVIRQQLGDAPLSAVDPPALRASRMAFCRNGQ
jgi:hypothetical protein